MLDNEDASYVWDECLNPCFRGSWFDGKIDYTCCYGRVGLNPCFRGSWFDGSLQ